MGRWTFSSATMRRLGCWCGAVLMLGSLSLSGCKTWDWGLSGNSEENAKTDPDFDLPRKCRPADRSTDFIGLSDRSRQIESNLGVGK
jgi:hypothetical protein